MWFPYILGTRTADCPKCKEATKQELRVENHTYIYAEGWVCLRCEKDPKGIPVVEPGEIRFRHDGETIKEAAKKKSIHKKKS